MDIVVAITLFVLALLIGVEVIGKVPATLHPVARPMRRHRDGSIINHFIQPCAHTVFTNHIAASGQEFGIIAYLEPIQYDHIHVEVHRP